jgi:hypothetical protein
MADRPVRVLVIAGSQRRLNSCPGLDSKARALMHRMAAGLPIGWQVDLEDLGNEHGKPKIQPCNACVSSSWRSVSGPAIVTGRVAIISLTFFGISICMLALLVRTALREQGLIAYGRGQIALKDCKGMSARQAKPIALPRPNIGA